MFKSLFVGFLVGLGIWLMFGFFDNITPFIQPPGTGYLLIKAALSGGAGAVAFIAMLANTPRSRR